MDGLEFIRARAEAEPDDLRRATVGKRAEMRGLGAERGLRERRAERIFQPTGTRGIDVTEKVQRDVNVVGRRPFHRRCRVAERVPQSIEELTASLAR
jgi:hypothetical protein